VATVGARVGAVTVVAVKAVKARAVAARVARVEAPGKLGLSRRHR
jgi:hypothetical protein